MIFVTVGSSNIPFDRLLREVADLRIDERLVVQHGAAAIQPSNAECIDFLGYDAFVEHLRDARVTVMHAGVGSIMTALSEHKHPIVVPRREVHGEAVDDHQVPFAQRLSELGLVTFLDDVEGLAAAVAGHLAQPPRQAATRSPLEIELRSSIEAWVGPRSPLVAGEEGTTWS